MINSGSSSAVARRYRGTTGSLKNKIYLFDNSKRPRTMFQLIKSLDPSVLSIVVNIPSIIQATIRKMTANRHILYPQIACTEQLNSPISNR